MTATAAAPVLVLLGLVVWCYAPFLGMLAERWAREPQYSHGPLVPLFAVFLLFWHWESRRGSIRWGRADVRGTLVITLGMVLHLIGSALFLDGLSAIAFLVTLSGIPLLWGGPPAAKWCAPAIGFLVFMIPLPYRVESALTVPLQTLAAQAGTFSIQLLGIPAYRSGNLIVLQDVRLDILEACSGLRMLVMLLTVFSAVALLSERSLGERILIVLSAPVAALFVNVLRVTFTAALHHNVSHDAGHWFHEYGAVFVMTPLALAVLGLELRLLDLLVAPPDANTTSNTTGNANVIPRDNPVPQSDPPTDLT